MSPVGHVTYVAGNGFRFAGAVLAATGNFGVEPDNFPDNLAISEVRSEAKKGAGTEPAPG